MLTYLLTTLVVVPILGFLGVFLVSKHWERGIVAIAITTVIVEFVTLLLLSFHWLNVGAPPVSVSVGTVYVNHHAALSFDFLFDTLAALFLGMATIITGLVFLFSRYYMHREQGFQRFYYTILLFFAGISFITLADTFAVLLIGWEFIGISSVLLIAFYRDRYLPARNALKVFSVYRIADAVLLLAIWYAHNTLEGSVKFSELSAIVAAHGSQFAVLGLLVCIAALIKSAQFPFSYWLPRAMEGPTASSAIFYGALSVHIGLFLVLRTYPLWEDSLWLRAFLMVSGAVTVIVATLIARVQSSIKTQIAYASITQIGIMYIEIAAGLPWLALLHFVSNASLRTYQLLISPSIAGYLVHDQFFHFTPPPQRIDNTPLGRMRATAYVLGIKEWDMNSAATRYVWAPLKSIGRRFAVLDRPLAQTITLGLFVSMATFTASTALSTNTAFACSTAAAAMSLIMYIRAHATKQAATISWNLIMLGHLFVALFLAVASSASWSYLVPYGAGLVAAFIVGHLCLWYLASRGESTALRMYHGHSNAFERLSQLFLIACLLSMAFPISPSFVAQDLLLGMIPLQRAVQVALFCLLYVLIGVSVMRVYTKVFFGPSKQRLHEIAYRSS